MKMERKACEVKYLFEYSDTLNNPFEAFIFDTRVNSFPVQSHWHYFVEIILVLEGTVWVNCNQENFVLNPNEMIFFQPQAVHSLYATTPQPIKYVVLKFDMNRLSHSGNYLPKMSSVFFSASKEDNLPITFTQSDFGSFSLQNLFLNCVDEIDKKEYGYDSYLEYSLSIRMLEILRIWRRHGFCPEANSYAVEHDYTINDILEYIDKHSHENIRVEELAEMCHMSYSYFAKTFHKLYGQSCKGYIEFIRLNKVENLLLFTNYDLNYISNETGFADCSHLIRIFKRKYGVTPKQYRMKYQKS